MKSIEGVRKISRWLGSNCFTLIELLIIIAIIAILAALLLPALQRAKYAANKILCTNNIKQMAVGLVNYTVDNNSYYPMKAYTGSGGVQYARTNGFPCEGAMISLAVGSDLRSLIRPYWGGNSTNSKTAIETCPLAAYKNTDDSSTSYMHYWSFAGRGNSTPYSDVHGNVMKRVGDPLIASNGKMYALISDVFAQRKIRNTNHNNLSSYYRATPAGWEYPGSWNSWDGPAPATDANFAAQDGSVELFSMRTQADNYTTWNPPAPVSELLQIYNWSAYVPARFRSP
jgi:type II secretory pathway pseudopilin PulG